MTRRQNILPALRSFLKPTIEEVTTYVLVLLVIAGIIVYRLTVFSGNDPDTVALTTSFGHSFANSVAFLSRGSGWAHFFLFGFWFFVGGISYAIIWAISTMISDMRKDIQTSALLVHPRSFSQSDFWGSVIARGLLRITAGLALGFYGIYWAWVIVPVCIAAIERAIHSYLPATNTVTAAVATIGLCISIHVGGILLRLVLLRPKNG